MGANEQNAALKELLERQEVLRLRGFTIACGPTGDVVVDRWNHVRGVWHFRDANFHWTPVGNNEPTHRVETLEQALAYSLEVISKT